MRPFDLAILNGTVVIPYTGEVHCDVGIRDGRIATLADAIDPAQAGDALDARGQLVMPGAVDSHFHLGIYRSMSADTESETRSALAGGVTSIISYFRTGQHYLNKTGPYREIFPEVLALTDGRSHTDYGFHIAIMTADQLGEVEWLVASQGVASFKYYMFYKGLNLTADSTRGSEYTMSDAYDLGHLYLFMQQVAASAGRHRAKGRISLSLHCEHAELIRVFIDQVKLAGLTGLEAYHRSRPPLTERLSMAEAVLLADAARCPINLLHLSSREAMISAKEAKRNYPHLDVRLETTLHHLALTYATAGGMQGKVNPPIRTEDDRIALWEAVVDGSVDTIVSDHACCFEEQKGEDLWKALPGFGGTALLYPYLLSEGFHRRGLSLRRVAELASANSARAFGLYPLKGTIAPGSDADLTIVDPERELTVTPDVLLSAQDFTPFAGMRIRGWPTHTILRGRVVYRNGNVEGPPGGRYLKRPVGLHAPAAQAPDGIPAAARRGGVFESTGGGWLV
ncbi:MAG: dihydroorotase [Armatimonadota bacterium]